MLNATLDENNGLRVWLPVIVVAGGLPVARKCRPPWRDQNMNFVNELHM